MKTGRTATFSGRAAEEIAERLYAAEGCRVLARRWRCPEGEIDLVIEEADGTIVFVEVKARGTLTSAAAAISRAQSCRLAAAIHRWLAASGAEPVGLRVDVVLVDRAGSAERIPNAITFDAE
jgi:putative endonuclease